MTFAFEWLLGGAVGFTIATDIEKFIAEIDFGLTIYLGICKIVIWKDLEAE